VSFLLLTSSIRTAARPRFSGISAKVEDNGAVVIEQKQDNNESDVE
jgi:hypothetical protein